MAFTLVASYTLDAAFCKIVGKSTSLAFGFVFGCRFGFAVCSGFVLMVLLIVLLLVLVVVQQQLNNKLSYHRILI